MASAGTPAASIKGTSLDRIAHRASELRIGIVHTQWNTEIIGSLLAGALEELRRQGVPDASVHVVTVPGSYELPFAAKTLIATGRVDAVIALGCLIKGATMHFEYICEAVTQVRGEVGGGGGGEGGCAVEATLHLGVGPR